MKKKIEAELVSLAHRILLLKNKSDINVLHEEARHLYEKLSVLRFMESHFSEVQPTIGKSEAFDRAESALEKTSGEPKVVVGEIPSEEELEREEEQNAPEAAASEQKQPEPEQKSPQEKPIEQTVEKPSDDQPDADDDQPDDAPPAPETEEPEETPPAVEEPKETPEVPVTAASPTLEDTEHFYQPESVAEVAAAKAENPEAIAEAVESLDHAKKAQFTIDPVFKPAFDLEFEPKTPSDNKSEPKSESKTENADTPAIDTPAPQFTFDDLLGKDYADPVFVKPEENTAANTGFTPPSTPAAKSEAPAPKTSDRNTLNDRLSKGITIGLNDRIAFMKHLFNNSSEDYNRVLSQLMTFDTYEDARMFIDDMVRPDYNNWEGKDEYAERFLEIVQKRFS